MASSSTSAEVIIIGDSPCIASGSGQPASPPPSPSLKKGKKRKTPPTTMSMKRYETVVGDHVPGRGPLSSAEIEEVAWELPAGPRVQTGGGEAEGSGCGAVKRRRLDGPRKDEGLQDVARELERYGLVLVASSAFKHATDDVDAPVASADAVVAVVETSDTASTTKHDKNHPSSYSTDDLEILTSTFPTPPPARVTQPVPTQPCPICFDPIPLPHIHTLPCSHAFCHACLTQHITTNLSSKKLSTCPQCPATIQPTDVDDGWLDPNVMVELWTVKLLEDPDLFFCPNKSCSTALLRPADGKKDREKCPSCNVVICLSCQAFYHRGMTCKEYKDSNQYPEEARELMKIAKKKAWKQCPKCKHMVERSSGCSKMKCHCGVRFCYVCGKESNYGKDGIHMVCGCLVWNDRLHRDPYGVREGAAAEDAVAAAPEDGLAAAARVRAERAQQFAQGLARDGYAAYEYRGRRYEYLLPRMLVARPPGRPRRGRQAANR